MFSFLTKSVVISYFRSIMLSYLHYVFGYNHGVNGTGTEVGGEEAH